MSDGVKNKDTIISSECIKGLNGMLQQAAPASAGRHSEQPSDQQQRSTSISTSRRWIKALHFGTVSGAQAADIEVGLSESLDHDSIASPRTAVVQRSRSQKLPPHNLPEEPLLKQGEIGVEEDSSGIQREDLIPSSTGTGTWRFPTFGRRPNNRSPTSVSCSDAAPNASSRSLYSPTIRRIVEGKLKEQEAAAAACGNKKNTKDKKKKSHGLPKGRQKIRTTKWVTVMQVTVLIGLMGWAAYNISSRLLEHHATWQWVAVGVLPLMFFFFAFALKVIISSIVCVFFASVRALKVNSEFYSAIPTPGPGQVVPAADGEDVGVDPLSLPDVHEDGVVQELPPVIVQIPVYLESLEEVIHKTYVSVLKAINHYKGMGGSARVLISDDGLMAAKLAPLEFSKRMDYYQQNRIAYVGRPNEPRAGLFKKASNMNYTLNTIQQLQEMEDGGVSRHDAMIQLNKDSGHQLVLGGDLRIPDNALILLLDADTRVPENAISVTVPEFMKDDCLPYTQHLTMPFSDQNKNYWECTISNFTRKIYTVGIQQGTALGDFAPLVGHNAFIRWSALKKVAVEVVDEKNVKTTKYWSEEHVSEDFDLFMRFASENMFGRYVVYTGDGFQEGVSLTYIDEIIKLRKFAYGACEMIFNKMYMWPFHGPFSPLIIRFMGTRHIPWYQKVSLLSYLATYFALASGPWLNLLEACLAVWAPEYYDFDSGYAIRGLDIIITCSIIFGGISPLAEVLIRWRKEGLEGGMLFNILLDNIQWVPTITILFSSCMFQLATAMLCYFFNLTVVWGATVKEVQDLTAWQALKATFKMFGWQFFIVFMGAAGLAFATYWYSLTLVQVLGPFWFCGFHLLGPLVLEPHIMTLSF